MELMPATLAPPQHYVPPAWPSIVPGPQGRDVRRDAGKLIHAAVQAVDEAMTAIFENGKVSASQTEMAAIHLCLSSATGLLDASETILGSRIDPTPAERAQVWQRLSDDAKTAGSAAYRAVLLLADPTADNTDFHSQRPSSLLC